MKLSFVIPAHNEEKLLPEVLRSIAREVEAHPEAFFGETIEVAVVNNASTDHTAEVARSFEFVSVIDEPNKGMVRARHAGFKATSGELVANIDADVIIPEGWLNTVLKEFENPRLVALSGPYVHYDYGPLMRALVKAYYASALGTHLLMHYVLKKGALLQGGNFIIRRDAWERAGGFDTTIAFYGEDTDVARRISKEGKVKFTFKLPMFTTARRMKREGLIKTVWHYALNFFSVLFRGRPATDAYTDVRD